MTSGAPYAENTAWCRAQISTMLFADGAYLPAKQVAEDAYKTAPNNYHVLIALAKVRAAYKDYKGAIDAYEKAVAIAPQHEALVALGDLYEVTGRKADAQKQYDLVEAVYNMNKAMGMKGDWAMALFYANHDRNLPEALQMVQEEYKTRPNAAVADSLAWCLYKNGQFTEAKKYAQVALAHGVLDSGYLYHAGMIDLKCNDTTAGQKLLDDCLSLSSQFHPIYARDAEKALREIGAPPRTVAQTTTEKP